jgi:hypothetical protein
MYKTAFVRPLRGVSAEDRFHHYAHPEPNTGCWLWGGCQDKNGYGLIRVDGKNVRAHRFAFELYNGRLAAGEYACHKCDNPACVNPDHLFAGNNSANQIDCAQKVRRGLRQKLTPEDAKAIKRLLEDGLGPTQIAKMFGVSDSLICNIKAGIKWSHVDNS